MLGLEKKGFSPYAPGCNRGHFTDLAKSQNSNRRFKKDETVKTTGNS